MTLQEEKELMLRVVTQLAAKLIRERGGFFPFGATLGPGRNVKLLMPKNWQGNGTRDEVEAYWSRELKKAVNQGECKTVCSCADVRIPIEDGNLIPCILIHIEQAQSCAEDIGYPYANDGKSEVKLGTPTCAETEPSVFVPSPA